MPRGNDPLTPEQEKLFATYPELTRKDGSFDFMRASAKYYNPELIEKIIASRRAGNSPRQSFGQHRIDSKTFDSWRKKLENEDCPSPLRYLFANILLDPKDDRYLPVLDGRTAFYYKPEIVKAILKYKSAGLSDRAAFVGAGIHASILSRWRIQVKHDPCCPAALRNLFRDMGRAEAKIMADVVSVAVREAIDNKNWKAALDLMPRLWRKEFGAKETDREPDTSAPLYNLDGLTPEEQETFIRLRKKCHVVKDAGQENDSNVKLFISLPDNGRA